MNSEQSPLRGVDINNVNEEVRETQEHKENDEDEEYEEEYENPIETKPFENTANQEPSNQEDVLKMINNPVERPTTRNPRMATRGGSRGNQDLDKSKSESMGEMHRKVDNDPESLKIEQEIKGGAGFALPNDSDDD